MDIDIDAYEERARRVKKLAEVREKAELHNEPQKKADRLEDLILAYVEIHDVYPWEDEALHDRIKERTEVK